MEINQLKAKRVAVFEKSDIEEILRVAGDPGIISLAGGLPAPEAFPLLIIKKLSTLVIKKYGSQAFQYGPTQGTAVLRKEITLWLKERGMKVKPENIGITSGSQGALDLLGRVFIEKGDLIAVESPTYLGAIDAFSPYQPSYVEIATDDQGAIPSSLERILKRKKPKFIYLVPTFQNPTGRTFPLDRRKKIAALIKKHQALLIEDDPYQSLRYQGQSLPPIQIFIPQNTVYLSSFSKVLAPGLRVGFYVAPEAIVSLMVAAKQSVDLHTSSFSQYLAAEYLKTGHLKKHLPHILKIYKSRQEAMFAALEKYFPSNFTWNYPEGGMFIWVIGPKNLDTIKLYRQAIKNKVAFVPGTYFFTKKGEGKNTLRLNFTNVGKEKIEMAIKKLAETIKKNL